ncbi:Transient receptor potential cation channel subfamily A member 1 [Fasciola gigantica]|uniref:Transient receptor potential cation channel subfamily A member 1 n=1 Tax=Fasciola gigantica TaxID=46835 RepID=A0A504ZDZ1_FASGI|nr:Transient receptor potential cation channel subfamily A member 1 [Fasciola gigantica]
MLDQANFEVVTALRAAAMNNRAEVVEYLLTAGAKILPANDGAYFVCMALQRKHHETLNVIIVHASIVNSIFRVIDDQKYGTYLTELHNACWMVSYENCHPCSELHTISLSCSIERIASMEPKTNPMHRVKIGLAVGDIEKVRRKACQQLLIQQIFWLADLESKFPKFIQTRLASTKAAQIVQQSAGTDSCGRLKINIVYDSYGDVHLC